MPESDEISGVLKLTFDQGDIEWTMADPSLLIFFLMVGAFVYVLAKLITRARRPRWSLGTWAFRIGVSLVWLGFVGVTIAQVELPWLNVYEWVPIGDLEVPRPIYDVFYPDLPLGRPVPEFLFGRTLTEFVTDYRQILFVAGVAFSMIFWPDEWEWDAWAPRFALLFGALVVGEFFMNREAMLSAQRTIDPAHSYDVGDGAVVYTLAIAAFILGVAIVGITGVARRHSVALVKSAISGGD